MSTEEIERRRKELETLLQVSKVTVNNDVVGKAISRGKEKIVEKSDSGNLKKYPCYYCDKFPTTISRHYIKLHSNELILQKLEGTTGKKRKKGTPLDDEQKFRDEIFNYLRKLSIDKHNFQADFDEQFITSRRARKTGPER